MPIRSLIIGALALGLVAMAPATALAAPAVSAVPTSPVLTAPAPAPVNAPRRTIKKAKKCVKTVRSKSGKKIKRYVPCRTKHKGKLIVPTPGKSSCSVINGVRGQSGASHRGQNALDYMVRSNAQGDAIFNWARTHWQACKIKYIIWQQRYYGPGSPGGKLMGNRGSPTANHRDHLHIEY